ncbi:MAG: fibronectin/fibrinogen-binding protein [Clostridiales bacterium]|nr:fibronectin/fibrinogen-binding protein [Clostridiales bacterium]
MPYDGLTLGAAARELDRILSGGRVDRVSQPERDEIHIEIRSGGQNHRLLLSASARYPRAHLTREVKPNPLKAPAFCMALRKRLTGGRVVSVARHDMERVLEIELDVRDEMGAQSRVVLRCEIMGRHSNIILTGADGRILDSIKHVGEDKSRIREVLPGLAYAYPPPQDRIDPRGLDAETLEALLSQGDGAAALSARLAGLSRATVAAIIGGADSEPLPAAARREAALRLAERIAAVESGQISPVLVTDPSTGEAVDFFPFISAAHPSKWQRPCTTLQQAMDEYYRRRDREDRMKERTAAMRDVVRRNLNRCERKLEKQRQTLLDAAHPERYRLWGELLTANLAQLRRGMRSVSLPNWYDPECAAVDIPLDPARDGVRNAQLCFKRYRKARVALELTRSQIEETEQEIAYLKGQLHNLNGCSTLAEAEEIAHELAAQGYMRPPRGGRRARQSRSAPLRYRSSDGYDIYVGRNNTQNDALTLRLARPDDIWLHTRQIPGSHVILRARDGSASDTAIAEAALLAAWHSSARDSSGVPVDYTARRNVKKPAGARPGMVIYTTHRTATVTPDAARVALLSPVDEPSEDARQ